MIIRGISQRDIAQIEHIHETQYKHEFALAELDTPNYLSMFSVVENDKVITAGGVRLIPEVVLVTDKGQSVRSRKIALEMALQASKYVASRDGHAFLHAFIQDEVWLQQLLRHGFRTTKGISLVTDSE